MFKENGFYLTNFNFTHYISYNAELMLLFYKFVKILLYKTKMAIGIEWSQYRTVKGHRSKRTIFLLYY